MIEEILELLPATLLINQKQYYSLMIAKYGNSYGAYYEGKEDVKYFQTAKKLPDAFELLYNKLIEEKIIKFKTKRTICQN